MLQAHVKVILIQIDVSLSAFGRPKAGRPALPGMQLHFASSQLVSQMVRCQISCAWREFSVQRMCVLHMAATCSRHSFSHSKSIGKPRA